MKRFVIIPIESLEYCTTCNSRSSNKIVNTLQLYRPLYEDDNNVGHFLEIDIASGMCKYCYAKFKAKSVISSFVIRILLIFGAIGLVAGSIWAFHGKLLNGLVILTISAIIILGVAYLERYITWQIHKSVTNNVDFSDVSQIFIGSGWMDNYNRTDFISKDCQNYSAEDLYNTISSICKDGIFCLYDTHINTIVKLTSENMQSVYFSMKDCVDFND